MHNVDEQIPTIAPHMEHKLEQIPYHFPIYTPAIDRYIKTVKA